MLHNKARKRILAQGVPGVFDAFFYVTTEFYITWLPVEPTFSILSGLNLIVNYKFFFTFYIFSDNLF